MRFRPTVELLESRDMPSHSSWLASITEAMGPSGLCPAAGSLPAQTSSVAAVPFAAPQGAMRWDWLANTSWYVPAENLLAYLGGPGLNNPVPVADQTLWHITSARRGAISGEAVVQLSLQTPVGLLRPEPMRFSFQGIVSRHGSIRITFTPTDSTLPATTGVGHMRWVDGAWRMEMQMASGTGPLVTHWAYMTQLRPGEMPPPPGDPVVNGSLRSEEWRWLRGTRWALADTALFGNGLKGGVFQIEDFRNGYFWGTGNRAKPFTVLGSVTPEGDLFLVISVDGGPPVTRTGFLQQTCHGWVMRLRSYEGAPAFGWARLLTCPVVGGTTTGWWPGRTIRCR